MNVRETIVKLMQDAGYDTLSACEHATLCLKEFREGGQDTAKFYVRGGGSFTLNRITRHESHRSNPNL